MEYCSACKSILKPEYTFCPFCGAKIPGQEDAEQNLPMNSGEVVLLAAPGPGDVVVYTAWETFEETIKGAESPEPAGKDTAGEKEEPKSKGKGGGKSLWKNPDSMDIVPDDPDGDDVGGKGEDPTPSTEIFIHVSDDPGKDKKTGDTEEPMPDSSQEEIREALPGMTVYLGGMPWHVLWVRSDSTLLVAGQPVVKMQLTEGSHQVSWRTSRLRKWLNKTFIVEFFNPVQREHLKTVKNSTTIRREDGYDFIESTEERVTILSRQEYQFYVPRSRKSSWELYNRSGLVRDLSSSTDGSGKISTLKMIDGKESWREVNTTTREEVYPLIWWRTD